MRSIVLVAPALLFASHAALAGSPPPPPAGASPSWMEQVTEDIRRAEYHLSMSKDGWTAPNRAHDMRATWSEGRLEVAPRSEDTGWRFTSSLVAIGRDGSEAAAPKVQFDEVKDGRLEWTRGGVREWYVNDERGIEQGFVIDRRPPGDVDEPLALTTAIDGLLAYPSDDASTVMLRTPDGKDALKVSHLKAWDAEQRELSAWFVVDVGILEIVVDDRDAVYPVTIDPLLEDPAWVMDPTDYWVYRFGMAVSTAGDVNGDGYSDVIVGAPESAGGGVVRLYLGSASGTSTTHAIELNRHAVSDTQKFGYSLAPAGDVNGDGYDDFIVGAPFDPSWGRAYLYLGSASGVPSTPSWTGQGWGKYGWSVASAGDVNADGFDDVLVGAPDLYTGAPGNAYVYMGSAAGLAASPAVTLVGSDVPLYMVGRLGYSLAPAGDVNGDGYGDVIVGAPGWVSNGEGDAYLYLGSASGLLSSPASSLHGIGVFGSVVVAAGDVNGDGFSDVAVASPDTQNAPLEADEGLVSVFMGSASGLAASPDWSFDSDQVWARIGGAGLNFRQDKTTCIAPAGDVNGDGYADLLVAAPSYSTARAPSLYDESYGSREGRAWLFLGSATGLGSSPAWTEAADEWGEYFGHSVATAGDVNGDGFSDVIIGSPSDEAAIYYGAPGGLATSPGWTNESNQVTAGFATSVASAGDIDGDGFSDVIVGAPKYDNGETDEGRAFLYKGSATGLATTAAWTAEGNQVSASFGHSVASAGDTNGDGYGDVIVGAPLYDNGQIDEGRAYLYRGSATGLAATPAFMGESNNATARYGWSVAGAGDVNRDGYGDLIVGAPYYDNGQTDEGAVYVYHGGVSVGATSAPREQNQAGALFGWSVTGAGDLDRDGYGDVAAGAPSWDNDQANEGRVYVYRGTSTGIAAAAARSIERGQASASFGAAVACAGDVNGDGFSDLLIGAPTMDAGQADEGLAYVFLGTSPVSAMPLGWTAEGDQANALYGSSVASAGDVNGDGYGDVIVGAPNHDSGSVDEGGAFVYLGAASGLGTTAAWTAGSDQSSGHLGSTVAGACDVNGDGYGDVIAGAPDYNNGQADEGRALLFYGNGGPGLDRMRRALRNDGTAPIDFPHATTNNSFRLRTGMRTPFGRSKVRLEVEVERLDTPFDGSGLIVSAFSDTGAPGASGSIVTKGHALGTLNPTGEVKWRARLRADGPFPWVSHWMGSARNGLTEADLRIQPSDLAVTTVTAPATSGEGVTITVSDTVQNAGTGTAAASTVRIWFSSDAILDASDVLLGTRSVPQLAPNTSSAGSKSVRLPSPAVGTYHLLVQADGLNVLQESNETNNVRSRPIVLGPDLKLTALTHPTSARVGASMSITSTTLNAGGGSAAASTTRFWLSRDRVVSADDVLLGSRAIPTLAPASLSTGTTAVTIPASTVPGSWYVVAAADALAVVRETIESNNERSNPITILP